MSSTAARIRFNTQIIQPRSITSAINPNFHLTSPFSSARRHKKNSRNHFERNRSRKLSFSVIFGLSDLISFSNEDKNARKRLMSKTQRSRITRNVRLKHDWTNSFARFCNTTRASKLRLSSRASSSTLFPFFDFCRFLESRMLPASWLMACCR